MEGAHVVNMDKTPVWFIFNHKRTLDLQGNQRVSVISSNTNVSQATVDVAVSTAMDMLKPAIVF